MWREDDAAVAAHPRPQGRGGAAIAACSPSGSGSGLLASAEAVAEAPGLGAGVDDVRAVVDPLGRAVGCARRRVRHGPHVRERAEFNESSTAYDRPAARASSSANRVLPALAGTSLLRLTSR